MIRTDTGEPVIAVWVDGEQIAYETWVAERKMALELPRKIDILLAQAQVSYNQLDGIVCFLGPGSFTGLRIGIAYANTLAYALQIPIVGQRGDDWDRDGFKELMQGSNDHMCMPEYGAEARITLSRK